VLDVLLDNFSLVRLGLLFLERFRVREALLVAFLFFLVAFLASFTLIFFSFSTLALLFFFL